MNSSTFYEKEYVALREKIELKTSEIGRLQILVGGANAGVYAWIFSAKTDNTVSIAAAVVPLALTLIAWLRHDAMVEYVDRVSKYIYGLEEYILECGRGPKGWEHEYVSMSNRLKLWRRIFWLGMVALCLAAIVAVWAVSRNGDSPHALTLTIY